MAKGSSNLRNRGSDASKPYDVSNSFVKRVASRVTELLPQPSSWLSRWMSPGSIQTTEFASRSNPISSRPPATSRAELNLVDNVDNHIPAKRPRTNRYNSPSQKFLRPEGAEELSPIQVSGEPVAGSSKGSSDIVASTPAIRPHTQDSTKVNGDDCSETSESTSGCSSLVPQAQSTIRSLGGSRYSRALHTGQNLESYQRRGPSFSTTTFTSPLRVSMRDRIGSSPFYSGRTLYGGSSQAYLPPVVHPHQRRVGPTVKPSPAQQTLPLSATAKRILDALEQFSTPVLDAKRMPVVGSKRKLESGTKRYAELSIPSTPDLLRIKREERLQQLHQSTSAARQASASMPSPPLPVEYTIKRDEDRRKQTGKLKGKDKIDDEPLDQVKLPSVALPVDNLPKIDIAIPPPPRVGSQPVPSAGSKFTFAAPKPVVVSGAVLPSVSASTSTSFKFSAPISETNIKPSVVNKISESVSSSDLLSLSRTQCKHLNRSLKRHNSKDSTNNSVPTSNKSPIGSSNVTNPFLKSTTGTPHTETKQSLSECQRCHKPVEMPDECSCHERIDALVTTDEHNASSNQKICSSCKNNNTCNSEVCLSCQSRQQKKSLDTSKNDIKPTLNLGFGNLSKKPVGSWECPSCLIQNKENVTKCVACETSKPSKKEKIEIHSANVPTSSTTSNTGSVGFGDAFKKPSGSWECQTCMIQNKPNVACCVACETPKSDVKTKNTPTTEQKNDLKPSAGGFGNMFKKTPGSWSCEVCMITNNADKLKCAACETPKPGATVSKEPEISASKFSFGIPTSSSEKGPTFNFGIVKEQPTTLPKPPSSIESSNTPTFTFGISNAESSVALGTTTNTAPQFQFGSTSALKNSTESRSSVESTTQSTKLDTKVESGKNEINDLTTAANVSSANVIPLVPTFELKNEKTTIDVEKKSTPVFSFGSNKLPETPNEKRNEITPSSTPQQGFSFGTSQRSFGSNMASSTTNTISSSSPSNIFKFGETKTVSSGPEVSSVSSVTTQSSCTNLKANNIFTFGSNTDKKESTFKAAEPSMTNNTNTPSNEHKPVFGTFVTTPNSGPVFGSSNAFSSGTFGNKETTQNTFVPQTTSNIFGANELKTTSTATFSSFGQTNSFQTTAQEKPSNMFTFGSSSSKESSGGFSFNPIVKKQTEPSFGFTANQANTPTNSFGFNNATPTPGGFNFEPKPFGTGVSPFTAATETPTPVFGAPATQQSAPSFGEQPTQSPVFAFGSQSVQPAHTPATTVFNFSSNQHQQSVASPSPAFVFGATPAVPAPAPSPAPAPAPAFDPNIKPTFNFTQGAATPVFSAIPTISTGGAAAPVRKIRKAVRRTNISSVRQT